jgi:glycosyltransferase involved in cell wall biosynthesis
MVRDNYLDHPSLVSIIIPCYNYGHYLSAAIESALNQTYRDIEIIVVDDGSRDNTKEVVQRYEQVIYLYQPNKGLAASRNRGVSCCQGAYIVFLDADDWLYPNAIASNLYHLKQNPQLAFVSGAYDQINSEDNTSTEFILEVQKEHYTRLLYNNYIAVPATVMFHRWVFKEFWYKESLKSCEDYDLYLNICRKYPVVYHKEKLAAYRKHTSNMSTNIPVMLTSALSVLKQQKRVLKTREEKNAYKKGKIFWKRYYCSNYYVKMCTGEIEPTKSSLYFLLVYEPFILVKFISKYLLFKKFKLNLKW